MMRLHANSFKIALLALGHLRRYRYKANWVAFQKGLDSVGVPTRSQTYHSLVISYPSRRCEITELSSLSGENPVKIIERPITAGYLTLKAAARTLKDLF